MNADQVERELRTVLDGVEAAYARGAAPAELMPMWYDQRDVVIIGAGDASAARGFPAVLARAIEVAPALGKHPRISFRIDRPIVAAEGLAVVMIDGEGWPDVPGADRVQFRLLTAWRRGAEGWRIVREMYSDGSL